jgi:hypothetical protein
MNRRDLLGLVGVGVMARWTTGCDKLVYLGEVPESGCDIDSEPITANAEFYEYTVYPVPEVDPDAHSTAILHEDVELATLDRAFVETLVARDKEHTLQCIGSRPRIQNIGNAIWSGLPLVEVLDALGVEIPATAVGLRIVGADTYHAGVPISDLDEGDEGPIWLVWRMNGEPPPLVHGAPYRLLVPGRYGVKNIKWPTEIAFVDTPHESYWTSKGWSEEAKYRANTFVTRPVEGIELPRGECVRFAGTAFAGPDPIALVEVSLDDGPWEPAAIDYTNGPDIWTLWSWDWTTKEGAHTIQVRCTTESGAVSAANPNGTDQFKGYDGSMRVMVTVA